MNSPQSVMRKAAEAVYQSPTEVKSYPKFEQIFLNLGFIVIYCLY